MRRYTDSKGGTPYGVLRTVSPFAKHHFDYQGLQFLFFFCCSLILLVFASSQDIHVPFSAIFVSCFYPHSFRLFQLPALVHGTFIHNTLVFKSLIYCLLGLINSRAAKYLPRFNSSTGGTEKNCRSLSGQISWLSSPSDHHGDGPNATNAQHGACQQQRFGFRVGAAVFSKVAITIVFCLGSRLYGAPRLCWVLQV